MTDDNTHKNQVIQTVPNDYHVNNDTFNQNMTDQNQRVNESIQSPDERGSDSVSGSTATPSSDDDILKNTHQMGIGINADLENPKELDLAKDIADAEEYRRTH